MMTLPLRKWYHAGGDVFARAAFSLAMCGALAGVLYVTSQHGAKDQLAASSAMAGSAATVLASNEANPAAANPAIANPAIAKSQSAIDASPIAVILPARGPVPIERMAEAPSSAHGAAAIRKAEARPVAVASAGFETCLPGCDTRDPLVVGQTQKAAVPGVSPSPSDELVEEVSYRQRTPSILGRALDAPGAVYQKGRDVLTSLARAAL